MIRVLQWALLSFVVVVMVMIGVFAPWSDLINEIIRTSAHIRAVQIAGIINLLESSPDETTHTYLLPTEKCNITINKNVQVIMGEEGDKYAKATAELITTDIVIQKSFIECNTEREQAIIFKREGNEIKIQRVG